MYVLSGDELACFFLVSLRNTPEGEWNMACVLSDQVVYPRHTHWHNFVVRFFLVQLCCYFFFISRVVFVCVYFLVCLGVVCVENASYFFYLTFIVILCVSICALLITCC